MSLHVPLSLNFYKYKMDCSSWLKNKTVNPRTGRKIKVGGPTYKALERECEVVELGEDDLAKCVKWRRNPLKNPETGRPIKRGGPSYRRWKATCEAPEQKVRREEFRARTQKEKDVIAGMYRKARADESEHSRRCDEISNRYFIEKAKSTCKKNVIPRFITKRILEIVKRELKGERVKRNGVINFIGHVCPEFKDGGQSLDVLKNIATNLADIAILKLEHPECKAGLKSKQDYSKKLAHQHQFLERTPVYGALLLSTFEKVRKNVRQRKIFLALMRRLMRANPKTFMGHHLPITQHPWVAEAIRQGEHFYQWMKKESGVSFATTLQVLFYPMSVVLNTVFPSHVATIGNESHIVLPAIWKFKSDAALFLPWVLGISTERPPVLTESDNEIAGFDREKNKRTLIDLGKWLKQPFGPQVTAIPVHFYRIKTSASHANVVVVNKKLKTLIYFEPHERDEGHYKVKTKLFEYLARFLHLEFIPSRGNYDLQKDLPWCATWCYYFAAMVAMNPAFGQDVKETMSFSDLLRFLYYMWLQFHHFKRKDLMVALQNCGFTPDKILRKHRPASKLDYLVYKKSLERENIKGKLLRADSNDNLFQYFE